MKQHENADRQALLQLTRGVVMNTMEDIKSCLFHH